MTVDTSTWVTKKGLAQMLKGGVIMDVVTPEHARIAEDAGAVAVMALERVPADIRASGGVARMSDPAMISPGFDLCPCRPILVAEMRKPFDVPAEGLLSEKSRGDPPCEFLFSGSAAANGLASSPGHGPGRGKRDV